MKYIFLIATFLLCGVRAETVKNVFEIALVMPLTGSDSASSQGNLMKLGAQSALQQYDERFKKENIAIKLKDYIYQDNAVDLEVITENVIKSRVIAAFGFTFSDHVLLVASKFQNSRLPLVTPDATANRIANLGKYIHPTSASNYFQASALVQEAENKSKSKRSVLIVTEDCGYCMDLANSILEIISHHTRLKTPVVIKVVSNSIDQTKLREEILKLNNIDVVFIPNYEVPSSIIIEVAQKKFPKATYLGGDGWSMYGGQLFRKKLLPGARAYALGHWSSTKIDTQNNSNNNAFIEMALKIPEESQASAAMAYDGMTYLLDTILECSSKTREALEVCINSKKRFNFLMGQGELRANGMAKALVLKKVTPGSFNFFKIISFAGKK